MEWNFQQLSTNRTIAESWHTRWQKLNVWAGGIRLLPDISPRFIGSQTVSAFVRREVSDDGQRMPWAASDEILHPLPTQMPSGLVESPHEFRLFRRCAHLTSSAHDTLIQLHLYHWFDLRRTGHVKRMRVHSQIQRVIWRRSNFPSDNKARQRQSATGQPTLPGGQPRTLHCRQATSSTLPEGGGDLGFSSGSTAAAATAAFPALAVFSARTSA